MTTPEPRNVAFTRDLIELMKKYNLGIDTDYDGGLYLVEPTKTPLDTHGLTIDQHCENIQDVFITYGKEFPA